MNFGEALEATRSGARIAREGWNGKGMFVMYKAGSANVGAEGARCPVEPHVHPYLMMSTVDGSLVPWVASQTDLLAYDWKCLPEHVA